MLTSTTDTSIKTISRRLSAKERRYDFGSQVRIVTVDPPWKGDTMVLFDPLG